MVDKWHQHAGQIVKDVLSHKRVKQEDFAEYLHSVTGGQEGTAGKDSFRNLLRRGTVTLTMFLHALEHTGTKLPPDWENTGKKCTERISPVLRVVNGMTTADALDESVLADPTAFQLLNQIEKLPPSDRFQRGLDLTMSSELRYRGWAADIAFREMKRANDDYVQLADKIQQATGRRITSRTLKRVFEAGDFQLALLLECIFAVRSPSLERFIDTRELEAAAIESLARRRQADETSDD